MKSRILFLCMAVLAAAQAQDPKAVVDSCVAALGGEPGVARFSDFEADGTVRVFQSGDEYTGKVKRIQKGNRTYRRAEFTFGSDLYAVSSAFDGKSAFTDRNGTVTDRPSLNDESDLDHTLSILLDKDAAFSLSKETEIEGRRVLGVEASLHGKKTVFYIDAETHRVAETVFQDLYFGENMTRETLEKRIRFSDYRPAEGGPFPMTMVLYEKGKKDMEYRYSEIRFNPEVPARLFDRPDRKLDLRYWEEKMD